MRCLHSSLVSRVFGTILLAILRALGEIAIITRSIDGWRRCRLFVGSLVEVPLLFFSVGCRAKSWVLLGFCCLLVGVTGAYLCTLLAFLEQWWLVLFFLFWVIAAKEVL